ncbi:MAG: nitroreductase family deazaflavin-dependent oxidoreductase [Chloroflexi bacterium]|nr:MAG: nitroreductase family deazaflavin-dependent oxidoreductase [Chloroflexota bacterium]
MPKQVGNTAPPTGLGKWFFRAPIKLYDAGLGWMMGKRFILLNHIGRKSGLPRQAVVEVVDCDAETDTYFIASGYGKKSQWYQNIVAQPEITILAGRRKLAVTAVPLPADESGERMVRYAHRYPTAAKNLTRLIGYEVDGTDEDFRLMAHNFIPFIALRPREVLSTTEGLPTWPFALALAALSVLGMIFVVKRKKTER